MKLHITRCLDLRYKHQDNYYPVCIRIYKNRKYDYINTGIDLTKLQYEDIHASNVKPAFKAILQSIINIKIHVTNYVQNNAQYNLKKIRLYIDALQTHKEIIQLPLAVHSENVFDWFNKKIHACKSGQQFGSAESYQSTKNVYEAFLKITELPFTFFTVSELRRIERLMMEERQIEISTVGKHARNLRAIFKMAVNEDVISIKDYPFGRYKYVIPEVTKAKKALSRSMMAALIAYRPSTYHESRAKAYFIFSYFGNGMNLKDMALLKYKDWENNILVYFRKKTKNTSHKLKLLNVIVTEEMKLVIAEFGNPNSTCTEYIFPILNKDMDEKTVNTKVHTRSRSINITLKKISKKLNFDKAVTLGMARHSFANALKQEGISISFIQESLGHGSASTTEHYLNSFEASISLEHIEKLKKYYS